MTIRIVFLSAAAGMLLALAFIPPARAVDKGTTVAPVRPAKMLPTKLSGAECKGLGGKVVEVSDCNGMGACVTTNQDGVIHKACLTKP